MMRFVLFFNYYHFDIFNFSDCKNIGNLYENMSKHLGYKVKPPEGMVNSLAYTYLYFKRYEESIYLFKLNVSNYPDSWNVYDAMGDFYDAKGDKSSALDNYKKVLSIKEIPDTRQKLEKLQGK